MYTLGYEGSISALHTNALSLARSTMETSMLMSGTGATLDEIGPSHVDIRFSRNRRSSLITVYTDGYFEILDWKTLKSKVCAVLDNGDIPDERDILKADVS